MTTTATEPILEARNVSLAFGSVRALVDVSVTLAPGEAGWAEGVEVVQPISRNGEDVPEFLVANARWVIEQMDRWGIAKALIGVGGTHGRERSHIAAAMADYIVTDDTFMQFYEGLPASEHGVVRFVCAQPVGRQTAAVHSLPSSQVAPGVMVLLQLAPSSSQLSMVQGLLSLQLAVPSQLPSMVQLSPMVQKKESAQGESTSGAKVQLKLRSYVPGGRAKCDTE